MDPQAGPRTWKQVILGGQVHTRTERDNAEDVAWRAPGVMNLENGLQVMGQAPKDGFILGEQIRRS